MKTLHILLIFLAGLLPFSAAAIITPVPQGQIYTVPNATPITTAATFTVSHPHSSVTYTDISRTAVLTFGIDHHYPGSFATGTHKVVLTVKRYSNSTLGSPDLSDTTVTMEISYSPMSSTFEDVQMVQIPGVEKYEVVLTGIYLNGAAVTTLQGNLYIHGDLFIDRITDFSSTFAGTMLSISSLAQNIDCDVAGIKDELTISWSPVTGAEEYQLEWAYVSNYPALETDPPLSASEVSVDFKMNSTRISTRYTNYAITLAFDKGYICYRVRAVGRKTTDPTKKVFGVWSSVNESGLVSTMNYYTQADAYEGGKNWQYSGTYAEEGKKKEVISFFDGTLRNRQMVTKVNSDDNTIVGETIYDHQGRPAIQVLPTPVPDPSCDSGTESALKYYRNFTLDENEAPYTRLNFDRDGEDECEATTEGMSNTSGASQYYSNQNPDMEGSQKYLPDAEKFPFSQVEYMPDNTGRIRRQGGVGPGFQLDSDHESKFYYSHPSQIQLDRMFGSEVGDYLHYQKNMVIDPNGQISISYLDQEGRVIATSLAGDAPENVSEIPSAEAEAVKLTDNMLLGSSGESQLTTDGNSLSFSETMSLSSASEVTFEYSLKVGGFSDSCLNENICLSCVYDLTLQVTDECGAPKINLDKKTTGHFSFDTFGNMVFQTSCDTLYSDTSITVYLPVGTYQVTKILTVNDDARDFFVDYYLDTNNNDCIKTLQDFVNEFLSNTDFSDCEPKDCADCLEHLGSIEDFVAAGYGTADDYQLVYDQCVLPCKPESYCESMKNILMSDMSPHGQYGQYELPNGTIQPTAFSLSVYSWANALPHSFDTGALQGETGDWQHPRIYNSNGTETYVYINEDGTRSKVQVQTTTNPVTGVVTATAPPTEDMTTAYVFQEDGQWYTYPENLSDVADFIHAWKPSWAASLVYYHPEFSYYRSCMEFTVAAEEGDEYTSESFDYRMAMCDSWQMAADSGFVVAPEDIGSFAVNDRIMPYWDESSSHAWDPYMARASHYGLTESELVEMVNNYFTTDGTNFYSIMQTAAIMAQCGGEVGSISIPVGCGEFGADPVTRDEEWRIFKSLYRSQKQEKLLRHFRNRALSNPDFYGYNGCIGNGNFNPFEFNFLLFLPGTPPLGIGVFGGQYFNDIQPCSIDIRHLYVDKQRRFSSPLDVITTDMNAATYQQFQMTGECQQASLFGTLLNQVAVDGELNSSSFLLNPYTAYPGFVLAMNNSVPEVVPATTWTQTASTSTTLSADLISGSTTLGSLSLTKAASGLSSFNWSDVFGMSALHYTGDVTGGVTFTINAHVHRTGESDTVIGISGFTTYNLALCGFYPGGNGEIPVTCTLNTLGSDVATLVSALAVSGELDMTSAYQVKGSSVPMDLLVTDRLEMAAEGSLSETDFYWKFDSGNQRFELYHSGSDPRLELAIVSTTPGTFTSANFGSIGSVAEVLAAGGNELDVVCNDASGDYLGTIRCAVSSVDGSTITERAVGACDSPGPCNGIAFDNYEELPALLEDVLVNQAGESYDLFASDFMTPGLASQLSPDTLATGSDVTVSPEPGIENVTVGPVFIEASEPHVGNIYTDCICYEEIYYILYRTITTTATDQTIATDSVIKTISYCQPVFGVSASCPTGEVSYKGFDPYSTTIPLTEPHTETTTISTDQCLELWVEGTPVPLSLEDVTAVSGFTLTGEPDGAGNFHEFFMTGTFLVESSYITDTIFGYTCIPIQKCCDPFDFMTISQEDADAIANHQEHDEMLMDINSSECRFLHSEYNDAISAFNSSAWAAAHSQTLTSEYPLMNPFLASGKCYCMEDYLTLINTYISASPLTNLPPMPSLSGFEGCQQLGGEGTTCGPAYLEYLVSITDYNLWAAGNSKPQIYQVLTQDAFIHSTACSCSGNYGDYLEAITAGNIVIGPGEAVREILSFCEIMSSDPCVSPPLFPSDTMPSDIFLDPCTEFLTNVAFENAANAYNIYINDLNSYIYNAYTAHCLGSVKEIFTKTYFDKEYHFTLYYYDQAGNLIKTIPPEGVERLDITSWTDPEAQKISADRQNNTHNVITGHRLASVYEYNSLNQLVRQSVPDQDPMDIWEKTLPNGLPSRLTTTAIQMVSTNVGYLSGYIAYTNAPYGTRGYLYRTENAGLNWTKVNNTIGARLNKVQMVTNTVGYAIGESGVALKTRDAGNSWDLLNTYSTTLAAAEFTDLSFTGASTGTFVTKDGTLYTTTTGTTFTTQAITGAGTILNVTAMEPTSGGWYMTVTLQGPPDLNTVIMVTTAGAATLQDIVGAAYNSVHYYSSTEGFAAGIDGNLVHLYTDPAGTAHTQTMKTSGISGRILEVFFVNADRGVVRAEDGSLYSVYYTYNGGETWTKTAGNYKALSLLSQTSTQIQLAGATTTGTTMRFTMQATGQFGEISHASLNPQSLDIRSLTSFASGAQTFFVAGTEDGKIWLSNGTLPNALAATYTNIGTISGQIAKKIIARKMPTGEVNILVLTTTGQIHSLFRTAGGSSFTLTDIGSGISGAAFSDMALEETVPGSSFVLFYNNTDGQLYRTLFDATAPAAPSGLIYSTTTMPAGTVINAIAFSGGLVTAVGENGALYTETLIVTATSSHITAPTQIDWTDRRMLRSLPLNDIHSSTYSGTDFIAAGNNGTLLKRTSADGSWRTVPIKRTENLQALATVSSGVTPVIAGANGLLATVNLSTGTCAEKTIATGLTVSQALNGETLYALAATGNQVYAAGKSGAIAYTPDITITAANVVKNGVADFYSLSIIPGQSGGGQKVIVTGSDSKVYRYTGTNGVQLKQVFGPRINDVHFDGNQTGTFAATTSYLRQTTDGGQTWKVILPAAPADHNISLNTVRTKKAPDGSHFALAGGTSYFGRIAAQVSTKINTNTTTDIEFNATHGNTGYAAYSYKVDKITLTPAVNTYTVGTALYSTLPATTHIINAIHVFDNGYIMSAGALSSVYYIDASGTASLKNTGIAASLNLTDIYFHDNTVGYVTGNNSGLTQGYVYRFKTLTFITNTNAIDTYTWTAKDMTDPIATGGGTSINVNCMAFGSRYDGIFGGNYTGSLNGISLKPYVRRVHDESGEFTARFFYDRLGRIVVSQNSRQYAEGGTSSKFSYTIYDALGRVTEAGEKADSEESFTTIFGTLVNNLYVPNVVDDTKLGTWLTTNASTTRKEVTKSYYDKTVITGIPSTVFDPDTQTQRKRIVHVTYEETYDGDDQTYDHATHYDYDIHGNVKTLVQDNKLMAGISDIADNRYKVMNYNYDLISGNVHRVDYQTGKTDQWHHAYSYDADNRITDVFTTTATPVTNPVYGQAAVQNEAGMTSYWDKEASYEYYDHGPLARTELGNQSVQGIDYLYTLQGWIKDVNSNTLRTSSDPGKDGNEGDHAHVATDVYGYSLHYFAGDYSAINGQTSMMATQGPSCGLTLNGSDLYNGNIGRMVTTITNPTTREVLPLGSAYRYDQLNRLKYSKSFSSFVSQNNWSTGEAAKYENTFTYDASGNILTQTRANAAGTLIDNLTYGYNTDANGKKLQNRLYHVADDVTDASFTDDIDDYGLFVTDAATINTGNKYSYDREGRLTRDLKEEIASIEWRVDGKVKSITRTDGSTKKNLKFDYDAMGRRIAKHVYTGTSLLRSTYYVLDAQGNVMSVYKREVSSETASVSYRQTERHIYGSDRIGMMKADVDLLGSVSMTAVDNTLKHTIGMRLYELKNHLGNVLSVISDKPLPQITNNFYGKFDGVNDRMGTSSFNPGLTTQVTLEAWMRTTDGAGTNAVCGQYHYTGDKGVMLITASGKIQFDGRNNTGTYCSSGASTTTVSDGEWHHVAGVLDGTDWKIYIDGVLENTGTYPIGSLSGMSLAFYAGRVASGANYEGDVKEVTYWNVARTQTQIAADMTATSFSGASLKGYWKLNEGAGTAVTDYASTPHNGTMTSGAYYGNDATVNPYLADIRQSSDYSPFGVTLEGRDFEIEDPDDPLVMVEEDAIFTNLSASTIVDAENNLNKVPPNGGWGHAGASCAQEILAGEYIVFEAGSEGMSYNSSVFVGLSYSSDPDYNYTSIDYAWYLYLTGTSNTMWENGVSVGAPAGASTFTAGTEFMIARFNGNIVYYRNGVAVRTVTDANPTTPMVVDIAMIYPDTKVYNLKIGKLRRMGYRYGFQGQEEDDEIKGPGNSLNYEYRMHDPRIGRFFAVDPLAGKYPFYSPYAFSGNRVINAKELEGCEPFDAFSYVENWFEGFAVYTADQVTTTENLHIALDVIGCVPVLGEVADGVNGVIYSFEGNKVDAAISYAAIIPVIGDVGKIGKYTVKIAKTADAVVTGNRVFKTAKGAHTYLTAVAKYGEKSADVLWDRHKLRNALSESAEATMKGEWRAHHLIPIETVKKNEFVQDAIDQGFDFNGVANGMAVDLWRHKGSHKAWNDMVDNVIEAAQNSGKYGSAKETMEAVANILEYRVKENSGSTIQEIGKKYNELNK